MKWVVNEEDLVRGYENYRFGNCGIKIYNLDYCIYYREFRVSFKFEWYIDI